MAEERDIGDGMVLRMRMAWWWPAYVSGVLLCSMLTMAQPDLAKVAAAARRAIRITIRFK